MRVGPGEPREVSQAAKTGEAAAASLVLAVLGLESKGTVLDDGLLEGLNFIRGRLIDISLVLHTQFIRNSSPSVLIELLSRAKRRKQRRSTQAHDIFELRISTRVNRCAGNWASDTRNIGNQNTVL